MAHLRQSRPDSGLDFKVTRFEVFLFRSEADLPGDLVDDRVYSLFPLSKGNGHLVQGDHAGDCTR